MIFLSVQHVSIYYLWQVQVMVFNLKSKGIRKEEIHILLATFKQQKIVFAEQRLLQYIKNNATSFFYEDTREIKAYPSSIRPHILAKHFALYPNLERERIFYHDCDIIFRELPPLFKSAPSQVWFVSDTSHYLGSHYIKSQIGAENFRAITFRRRGRRSPLHRGIDSSGSIRSHKEYKVHDGIFELSCRAKSRHPVAKVNANSTGSFDFAALRPR